MALETVGLRAVFEGANSFISSAQQASRAEQDLVKQTQAVGQSTSQATGGVKSLDAAMQSAGQSSGGLSDRLRGIVNIAAGFAVGNLAVGAITKTFGMAKDAVFGMNSQLETSQIQFETLFKDADRAREHVAMLFEFAKKTPFETQPIIEASRMLQTFGGDALNTQHYLTLIGDAAAGTTRPINELAFWVGRAYSAIKGGQPFGEAAMRLQELAVLTPATRQEMEKLQKAGKSADEIFKLFEKDLERFSGGMEKQAGTWSGVTSTFSDTIQILAATAFKPFFRLAIDALGTLNEILSLDAVAKAAEGISLGLGFVIDSAKWLVKTGVGFIVESLRDIGAFDAIARGIDAAVSAGKRLLEVAPSVGKSVLEWATAHRWLILAINPLIGAGLFVYRYWGQIRDLFAAGWEGLQRVGGWLADLGKSALQRIDLGQLVSGARGMLKPISSALDAADSAIAGFLRTNASRFAGWVQETAPKIGDWAAEVGGKIADWADGPLSRAKEALVDLGQRAGEMGQRMAQWATGFVLGEETLFGKTAGQWRESVASAFDTALEKLRELANWAQGPASAVGDFFRQLASNAGDLATSIASLDWGKLTAGAGRETVDLFGSIGDAFSAIGEGIVKLERITELGDMIRSLGTVFAPLVDAVRGLGPSLSGLGETFSRVVALGQSLMPVVSGLAVVIGATLVGAMRVLSETIQFLAPYLAVILAGAIRSVQIAIETAIDILNALLRVVTGVINTLVGLFTGDWSRAWSGAQDIVGGFVDFVGSTLGGLKDTISNILDTIFGVVDVSLGKIKGSFETAWEGIVGAARQAFGGLKSVVSGPINSILGTIEGFVNAIIGAINWVTGFFGIPGLSKVNLTSSNNTGGWAEAHENGQIYSFAAGVGVNAGLAEGTSNWRGGWAMVGERGPELAYLPQGSVVIPNHKLRGFADGLDEPRFIPGVGYVFPDGRVAAIGSSVTGGAIGAVSDVLTSAVARVGETVAANLARIPGISDLADLITRGPRWLWDRALSIAGVVSPRLPWGLGPAMFGWAGRAGFDWVKSRVWPFAEGGIVTAPMIASVGEAGAEAIIPLSQLEPRLAAPIVRAVNDLEDTVASGFAGQIGEAVSYVARSPVVAQIEQTSSQVTRALGGWVTRLREGLSSGVAFSDETFKEMLANIYDTIHNSGVDQAFKDYADKIINDWVIQWHLGEGPANQAVIDFIQNAIGTINWQGLGVGVPDTATDPGLSSPFPGGLWRPSRQSADWRASPDFSRWAAAIVPATPHNQNNGVPTITIDASNSTFSGTPRENGEAIADAVRRAIERIYGREAVLAGVRV